MTNGRKSLQIFFAFVVVMGAVASGLFGYFFFYRYPIHSTRAFKISSDSMCPTACVHERILVTIDPSVRYTPRRGDVIAMSFHHSSNIFVKRVIGIPGDKLSPGPDGTIKINDVAWQAPAVCGTPINSESNNVQGMQPIKFHDVKVPAGSYFVIGDNLFHSLDSRTEEFGLVPESDVLGKALVLYYSPQFSRIGCPVR